MRGFARHALFVFTVAVIIVVGSERMFWYWSASPLVHPEAALFYSASAAAFLAVLRRFEVHSLTGVVLATPIVAYVTEGVITPVLYSGGPTPFFPLWFTAWHGLLSALVLFVLIRRWAIAGRTRAVAGLSLGLGAFWGTWLITSLLPDQLEDPELVTEHGELVAMAPTEFAVYATTFTAIALAAHLVLDRVWPIEPTTLFARTEKVLGAVLLVGAAAWTVAAPWALPMFVGLCWVQFRVLRRHRDHRPVDRPTVLESMRGPASWRSLTPVVLMAPVAALTYWAWWSIEPSEAVLNGIYFGVIAVQTLIAGAVLVVSWRRTRRAPDDGGAIVESSGPSAPADATVDVAR
ncbi:MAG: hypothetical protein AAF945_06220 [Actinomycetota bacterium]